MQLSDIVGDPAPLLAAWPTEPIRWQHAPDRFAELLTMEEVNAWVDAECVALRNLELIEDGRVVERHRYQGPRDMPAPGRVRAHLDAGGTVSLRHLETVKPSVSRLRAAVQEQSGCAVHVNAYVTPGGCQGFRYQWLRGEMERHPPLDSELFSIDTRVGYAEQTLRQDTGADVVWGYYSTSGQYVSRAVIRCLQGKAQPGVRPVHCPEDWK
jgi:hypothetical protein